MIDPGSILSLLLIAGLQQDPPADPPEAPPATEQATPEEAAPEQDEPPVTDDAPPSLDELLGVDDDNSSSSSDATAEEERQQELERTLQEESLGELLDNALLKMGRSAELLDVSFDPGLGTQRIQEEILADLDRLIEEAQSQQSSSSSSSSSQQQQQQQQQNPGQNQQQQQQQGQDGQQESQTAGDNAGQGGPPAQDAQIGTNLEESREEWGRLPARVRDLLLQGSQDEYSSLYQQMTSEYYRRLAEEAGN